MYTAVYLVHVHVSCFLLWVGILPFIVRTYLVCVASSRVLYCWCVPRIILSSLACIRCLGSTAQQQSSFTLESLVPYCRSVRHVPTLKMRVVLFLVPGMYKKKHHQQHVHCCMLVHVSCFFGGGLGSCPLLYVRTSCVSRHPVSYIVSAYLVSYCLLELFITSREHSTGAVGFHFGVPRTILS